MQIHYVEESSDPIIGEELFETINRKSDFPQTSEFCRIFVFVNMLLHLSPDFHNMFLFKESTA